MGYWHLLRFINHSLKLKKVAFNAYTILKLDMPRD